MHIDIQRDHARANRKTMPRAEVCLWQKLRRRGLNGIRFNRQVEIGPYIADFVCREHKLIVELDGATHVDRPTQRYDQRRTQFLESKGYRVLRFENHEVFYNLNEVLGRIVGALK